MRQPDTPNELQDLLRLGDVAGERFLAGDPLEGSLAGFYCVYEFFDVLDARVVRPAHPDRFDLRVGDHVRDGRVRFGVADVERARERRSRCRILLVRAPDTAHIGVADGLEALDVEAWVEAAADEADAEGFGRHDQGWR